MYRFNYLGSALLGSRSPWTGTDPWAAAFGVSKQGPASEALCGQGYKAIGLGCCAQVT